MDFKEVITVILVPVVLGLAAMIFKQGQQTAIIKTEIGYIKKDIETIKDSLSEVKNLVNLFIKNEIDALKKLTGDVLERRR